MIANFIVRVKDRLTLELPDEARVLGLKPGDEVEITVDCRDQASGPHVVSGVSGLSIMSQIAERHKGRRTTSSSSTARLLSSARSGSAYGYEPAE